MKRFALCFLISQFLALPTGLFAQNHFSSEAYSIFLQQHEDMSAAELLSQHAPDQPYYNARETATDFSRYAYFDSLMTYLPLTDDERAILNQYQFMVSERMSYGSFGRALHEVYMNDLPVMVTTDAILHALHMSYDRVLMDLELSLLGPNLRTLLRQMHEAFPELAAEYPRDDTLRHALSDVDLYVTVARRLLAGEQISPHMVDPEVVQTVINAIHEEKVRKMALFTYEEDKRDLDFSQFTVRGHYTRDYKFGDDEIPLSAYFKAMMWLGRIDLLLTVPPPSELSDFSRASVRRMNVAAVMIQELLHQSGAEDLLDTNDEVIRKMVGESDNLTPAELAGIKDSLGVSSAADLLNDSTFAAWQNALTSAEYAGQEILSSIIVVDPYSPTPDPLPVSFKLLGQRFILDSYVLSNLVYDRVLHQGSKVMRMMPDPLDAMFVLGNDDALPLIQSELEQYHYADELAALRYLTDAFDPAFWEQSLYNTWLQAIRTTNPSQTHGNVPFFMQTTAWHQEKLNTQLASWAQLRHDNLLYAKQSYTGATTCSFPHSFVEPFPGFYSTLSGFASRAREFLGEYTDTDPQLTRITTFFTRMSEITDTLAVLAEKELNREPFSADEQMFLKRMLFQEMGSGSPPYSGWYAQLYYDINHAAKEDYVVADVHTQPTDPMGAPVGKILHVGVGKINLGVFLADAPSNGYRPTVFIGPVMSYYSTITKDFDRLTDERWTKRVYDKDLPERPEWVYPYMADEQGERVPNGMELPGIRYTTGTSREPPTPNEFSLDQNYPNPFNPTTAITYTIPENRHVTLRVYDLSGRLITILADKVQSPGTYTLHWDGLNQDGEAVSSGVYLYRLSAGKNTLERKMILLR